MTVKISLQTYSDYGPLYLFRAPEGGWFLRLFPFTISTWEEPGWD